MIDFEFSEDHRAVEKLVRDFCAREILPDIRQRDREAKLDPELMSKLAGAGIFGLCLPPQYGGSGLDYVALGIACEETEYADTSARVILSVQIGLVALPILTWGNESVTSRFLPGLVDGTHVGAFGLTEPEAGSDIIGIRTTADLEGDSFRLNGEKTWISLADVADTMIIFAWTDREKMKARDHSGLSAFIVERSMDGVSTSSIHGKVGIRAGNSGSISLSDVIVPRENLLGEIGEGFKIAMFCIDQGRFTVAAGCTGLIRACRDACLDYCKTRKTFTRALGEHQLVKEMIANMVAGYDMTRLLWLKAAWLKNIGKPNTRETSMAKWIAAQEAEKAAADAVQVHGAYGFTDEYPVERFYRNAKGSSIYEGTREMHKLIQADYALGFRRDPKLRRTLPVFGGK